MNQKLRSRHRKLITLVAVITPVVFALSLLARQQPVTMNKLPVYSNSSTSNMTVISSSAILLDETTLTAEILQNPDGQLMVQLKPAQGEAVIGADVLVYWHDKTADLDAVPPEAHLLGALAGSQTRVFEMPGNNPNGQLLFYSLAQKRMYENNLVLSQ